jgi:hypothetical protein
MKKAPRETLHERSCETFVRCAVAPPALPGQKTVLPCEPARGSNRVECVTAPLSYLCVFRIRNASLYIMRSIRRQAHKTV